ncbi:putative NRPS-like protein biosynthetic cluster [Diaporthe australafricana]|uniref:NRPS-like protein biosynthetic cluster n=1 Tax=Diaporthe australafricana TaxID=127596 RepID=A0ABR3VYK7_9PEZI
MGTGTMEKVETHLNYFTCTLGEAARWNAEHPHPFHTVNHLIDEQAEDLRQTPAVNFPGGCFAEDGKEMKSDFTYRELRTYSLATAARLRRRLQVSNRNASGTVGLLCSSTPEFILTWLGLMRLGISVMLLAPQLERTAIKHLCVTCNVSVVFADARNYDKVKNLKDGSLAINISNILYNLKPEQMPTSTPSLAKSDDIAYLFHTSGTSSGLPKPIPQTHYAAVGVLPRLPSGTSNATFSTTPLYHGGIADCFRAWASGATIHLFPGTLPITAVNVQRAVDRANSYCAQACPVKYFTSVPYILQMLGVDPADPGDDSGLKLLQSMDLVGVGGAALPPSVGDLLAASNVKLVSRFGSAECGFLLSSQRDYNTDREWSYLRADPSLQPDYYDFEPQAIEDGEPSLFEVVVKPKWPHRGKTNRPDGSFATADLFERHSTTTNAWRYHSRADAQITLLNGKKFDPAPVEGELLASEVGKRVLSDVMIFGTGRDVPGILLFPKSGQSFASDDQIVEELWPIVDQMNQETQNHARLARASMIVVKREDGETPQLPKSSKGTILRGQAEKMFARDIEEADNHDPGLNGTGEKIPDSKVMEELGRLFDNALGRHIDSTADLFAQGVDSLACSQLRKHISKTFFPDSDISLPLNVIYDQGSIECLSKYILRCRVVGEAVPDGLNEEDQDEQLMLDLVDNYRREIQSPAGSFDHQQNRVVVLTGATGALGAHILDILLQDPNVSRIFCLVRAEGPDQARERILKSLRSRQLTIPSGEAGEDSKLVSLPCSLSDHKLGLSGSEWERLADETTLIIHSAWSVNFTLKLRSFQDHLNGLANLLDLRNATRSSAARLVFISSTASVTSAAKGDHHISETLSFEPDDASPLGYSRSKWVAENILASARVSGRFAVPISTSISGLRSPAVEERAPIMILRVGQLCGNSRTGAWNATEAYPIMLSSARITGCLPDLPVEALSWLPVDLAARSVLEIAVSPPDPPDPPRAPGQRWSQSRSQHLQKTPVYHVLNPHQEPEWMDMLGWICGGDDDSNGDQEGAAAVSIVPADEWVARLEQALETRDHPARALLHLWKEAYGIRRGSVGVGEAVSIVRFETWRTEDVSETMRAVRPLGREDVLRMWRWIQANV